MAANAEAKRQIYQAIVEQDGDESDEEDADDQSGSEIEYDSEREWRPLSVQIIQNYATVIEARLASLQRQQATANGIRMGVPQAHNHDVDMEDEDQEFETRLLYN